MKPFIVAAIFIAALSVVLGVAVTASMPVLKLRALSTEYTGGYVRVDDGKIAEIESIEPLRFKVAPESDPGQFIVVESKRTVPENFKIGVDVGLEGEYDSKSNVFTAHRISTQCPSKYEATRDAKEAMEQGGADPTGSLIPAGKDAGEKY
jgi:cytochrome c-type biogenesis protein CcmE